MANPYTVRLNDNEYNNLTDGGKIPLRDAILSLLQRPPDAAQPMPPNTDEPQLSINGLNGLTLTITLTAHRD